jgi:hypothetical protein
MKQTSKEEIDALCKILDAVPSKGYESISEASKTAVEWLTEKMQLSLGDEFKYVFGFFEQAKEMEKQQIIDAHGSKLKNSRGTSNFEYWYTGEQYYNETYKKQ